MGLPKGRSNNLHGRPRGSLNKNRIELRERITSLLEKNFDRVEGLIPKLRPKDQIRAYIDLLQYSVPKLQAVNVDATFERLDDDQLDELLNRLRNGSIKYAERENNVPNGAGLQSR